MIKTSELVWQDTQHQALFRLIDQIREEPFDRQILGKLQLYAEHHFCIEEAYMETLNFPQAATHITAHNRFREELIAMVETQDNIDSALQEALFLFLSKWLKLHVYGIDKELEAFILASNIK